MQKHHHSRLLMRLLVALLVLLAGTLTWGQEPADMDIDYGAMLRALQPTMTFEVTEANINAYLKSRPAELNLPEGFRDPRVALTNGVFEVSARKDVLFLSSRVRMGLVPTVVDGRLRLKVSHINAGPIPLPPDFDMGVAKVLEGVVNRVLKRNEMELVAAVVERDLVRVTARVAPPPPPAGLEAAP